MTILLLQSLLQLLQLLSITTASAEAIIITKTITAGPSSEATAIAAAPEFTSARLFTSAILNSTNTYREQHNASRLVWNRTLEDFANRYLAQVVFSSTSSSSSSSSSNSNHKRSSSSSSSKCDFKHSGGPYGENLALGCANATSCVEAWGSERRDYDFGRAQFDEATGHFTQLVWKGTTSVGCGARMCGGGDRENGGDNGARGWYLVCEYWPRGNVIGKFGDEVQAQEGGGASSRVPGWWGLVAGLVGSVFMTTTVI